MLSTEQLDRLDYEQNPKGLLCAYCHEIARGYATINGQRVCHPNNPEAPDCFTLAQRHDGSETPFDAPLEE